MLLNEFSVRILLEAVTFDNVSDRQQFLSGYFASFPQQYTLLKDSSYLPLSSVPCYLKTCRSHCE